jgi:hypothetical protein
VTSSERHLNLTIRDGSCGLIKFFNVLIHTIHKVMLKVMVNEVLDKSLFTLLLLGFLMNY